MTGSFLALGTLALAPPSPARAHPAHAKPVNYPFVVAFERFHSSLDDEGYLAEGGFLLLNELNCVACHAPPPALAKRLPGFTATSLEGVASRLSPVEIEIFVRNPRFAKRDTVMPSLFAGPDRNLDEVAALSAWLGSLVAPVPDHPVGDIERGRALYHRIGCVACHAPELGYRPPGVPENAEIELAGLPSVPMNLADFYDLGALTDFLLDPNRYRPSGRMPDFQLSSTEASDLAAYLKAGPDLTLPANLVEALAASVPLRDEALVAKGRELFLTRQCHACHQMPGADTALAGPQSRPLTALDAAATGGCFSERPVGGPVPFYGLDAVQKRAISAAMQRLGSEALHPPSPVQEIDWRMKQLNCYACHERTGMGGPETAREVYFGFRDEAALALGRSGHLPPALDGAGTSLPAERIARVLSGKAREGSPRPHLLVPMPRFLPSAISDIGELLRAADETPPP